MRHKINIIMPSQPSQLRFSAEWVSSELSRPTRDSDSFRSGPRRIRLGQLVSDSAESLNRANEAASSQMKVAFEVTNATIAFQMRNLHENCVLNTRSAFTSNKYNTFPDWGLTFATVWQYPGKRSRQLNRFKRYTYKLIKMVQQYTDE